jgi:hypothetical protein
MMQVETADRRAKSGEGVVLACADDNSPAGWKTISLLGSLNASPRKDKTFLDVYIIIFGGKYDL